MKTCAVLCTVPDGPSLPKVVQPKTKQKVCSLLNSSTLNLDMLTPSPSVAPAHRWWWPPLEDTAEAAEVIWTRGEIYWDHPGHLLAWAPMGEGEFTPQIEEGRLFLSKRKERGASMLPQKVNKLELRKESQGKIQCLQNCCEEQLETWCSFKERNTKKKMCLSMKCLHFGL